MRNTDRWFTPGVLITGLLALAVVLLGLIAAVAWLARAGVDPAPMLKLVGLCATGLGSLGTFVLTIANRATVAKTERNTGVLASAVYEVADAMPRPTAPPTAPRHLYPDTAAMPPVNGAAPAPRGS